MYFIRLEIENSAIEAVFQICDGDMRKVVNMLQVSLLTIIISDDISITVVVSQSRKAKQRTK